MSGWLSKSLQMTWGWRPFWIALFLLALTEGALHYPTVRQGVETWSERLWLKTKVANRADVLMPAHQDLAEEPLNLAYFRGLALAPARTKIMVIGDSVVWQAPRGATFHLEMEAELRRAFPEADIAVYALGMPGMNDVAAYYALKSLCARAKPALVVYTANPFWTGQVYANVAGREIGFIDESFVSAQEAAAYKRLIDDSRPPAETAQWPSFIVARDLMRLRNGSSLRSIMLPPAVFMGLSSRCYEISCQDTSDVYWRDLKKKKKKKQGEEMILNCQKFILGDQSIDYTYLMLIPALLKNNHVPMLALIPPKNIEQMRELEIPKEEMIKAGKAIADDFSAQGVPTIDCTEEVAERMFRDVQHLRADGFHPWMECVKPGLLAEMKRSVINQK